MRTGPSERAGRDAGKAFMNHADTFWLNITNVALGLAIAACLAYAIVGLAYDRIARRRSAAKLDRELREFTRSAAWLAAEHVDE